MFGFLLLVTFNKACESGRVKSSFEKSPQNSLTTFTPPHPEISTPQDPKDPNDKNLGDEEVAVENVVEDGNESIHTTRSEERRVGKECRL